MRAIAVLAVVALTACSGGGTSPNAIGERAPIATSGGPVSTSSQTRTTFVIHWPTNAQAVSTAKRRQTISPSTQSISVTVNGSSPTIVNKPTTSGSPATTSVSIAAPAGYDGFTFIAWDQLDAIGNVLDQATVSQNIVADANNTVSVSLDGICAALVPTLSTTPFATAQNTTSPLVSGSRTILKSARLIGPSAETIAYTRVDADGNTILTSAGVSPIAVREVGTTTPHVTIAPVASGGSNTSFTLTPIVAEPDGFSTTVTATAPDCGTGSTIFPNSFQVSTVAEIVMADVYSGLVAYDQDGTELAQFSTTQNFSGVAYNSKSGYLVGIVPNYDNKGISFLTLSPTGSTLGSGSFIPQNIGNDTQAAAQLPGQLVYDPASGYFYFTLQSTSTTVGGAVEEYSFTGSTATFKAATDLSYLSSDPHPDKIAAGLPGTLIVNDESYRFENNATSYTYTLNDALSNVESKVATATTSVSFDSTRDMIVGFSPYTEADESIGLIFNQNLVETRNFVTPQQQDNESVEVSAYNPANDELYLFDDSISPSYGLSGATAYEGGSTASNLPGSAFSQVGIPSEAAILP